MLLAGAATVSLGVSLQSCVSSEAWVGPGLDDEADVPRASRSGAGSVSQKLEGEPQVVFVDFDGPTLTDCDDCSSAENNQSLIVGYAFGTSSVELAPYTSESGRAAILAELQSIYSAYNVQFVTVRPESGPYTMLVITPTIWAHHGIGPLDCDNANKSDIAFVFYTSDSRFYPTWAKVAQAGAHELGHTFGLDHVTDSSEVMQWASSGDMFGVSAYDRARGAEGCTEGELQDAPALLEQSVGLAPAD
jgi:hypothetical protein